MFSKEVGEEGIKNRAAEIFMQLINGITKQDALAHTVFFIRQFLITLSTWKRKKKTEEAAVDWNKP